MRTMMPCLTIAAALWVALDLGIAAHPQDAALDLSLFKHVSRVGWVVEDLDDVVAYWTKLGLRNIRRAGVQEVRELTWRGRPAPSKFDTALANIGDVTIQWLQPLAGENAYSEFLARHGDGIHHLAYTIPTEAHLRNQIAAFRARGVDVVQERRSDGPNGRGLVAYLDTAPRGGGLTIALEHNPDSRADDGRGTTQEYPFTRITQYAFLVRDVAKVSEFYRSVGFGPLPFDRNISVDRIYRGRPVPFEMYLGWGRHGDVPFEWIQSLVGPNVYEEHLEAHGEGFHHLAFNVRDMDDAIALLKGRGANVTQSGGWDTPKSKGRFAYLDTERFGGVTTELLWNKP